MNPRGRQQESHEFVEHIIQVNRVSKKTKGGNQMSFSVLVVVGDKKGRVGVGLGKAKDVSSSVKKGVSMAKRDFIHVPIDGTSIPFPIRFKYGASKILLKPAPPGSGIIAGGSVRAVLDAAGVRDVSSKVMGTNNPITNIYATIEALRSMNEYVMVRGITLKTKEEIAEKEKIDLKETAKKEETAKPAEKASEKKVEEKKPEVKKVIAKAAPKKSMQKTATKKK